jgi:acyl-CoA dehydrogenase
LYDVVFILQAPHGHAETLFTDVTVPVKDACLLGEGRGFEIAQGRLGPGRLHHCMRLIGMGERALTLAARRAEVSLVSLYLPLRLSNYLFNRQARVAFGQPLSKNASVLQTLGKMRVRLDGAKLATLDAARLLDAEGNKSAKGAIAACKGEFILIIVRAIGLIGLTSFFCFKSRRRLPPSL